MSQILAFDFGLARIGVAVGQPITGTATPLATLKAKEGIPDWQIIEKLIMEWHPKLLLVGEPFNMDSSDQQITLKARKFANRLHGRFGLPFEMFDDYWPGASTRLPPGRPVHRQAHSRGAGSRWGRSTNRYIPRAAPGTRL